MSEIIYFFIDGGYIRRKYAEAIRRVFGLDAIEPDLTKLQSWCYGKTPTIAPRRFFYYDCIHDIQKDNETDDDVRKRVAEQTAMFERIQAIPGFHVRQGSLSGTGKKARQKKVDVLLAVEMLDHAFRKNMTAAYLVSGDGDFVPVVEAVTRLGTWVEVHYHPSGASKELYSAADKGTPISFGELWGLGTNEFIAGHPLPTVQYKDQFVDPRFQSPMNIKTGTDRRGQSLTVAQRGSAKEFFITVQRKPSGGLLLTHNDRNVLEKYYEEEHGQVVWD